MSTRIEFVSEGFAEILGSEWCAEQVENATKNIAPKAGEGFSASMTRKRFYGTERPIGYVTSDDWEAYKAETEDKLLSGAVL